MNNRTEAPKAAAPARQGVCAAAGCAKPVLELAAKNGDEWCSRQCCELAHGLSMAADLGHGGVQPAGVTKQRTLGGVAVATTRLMREAQARSLEAHARVARETRSGRHARAGGDQ